MEVKQLILGWLHGDGDGRLVEMIAHLVLCYEFQNITINQIKACLTNYYFKVDQCYKYYIQQSQQQHMFQQFDSPFRPWQQQTDLKQTNTFNNLKTNLTNYQNIYKRHHKSRSLVPENLNIHRYQRNKTEIDQSGVRQEKVMLRTFNKVLIQKLGEVDRSKHVDLVNISYAKLGNTYQRKCTSKSTSQINQRNKENSLFLATQRKFQNKQNSLKPILINFDDFSKYKRLSKRQIHRMLFSKTRKPTKPNLHKLI